MADEYSDRQARLQIDGIERLRTPRRCVGCGGMTVLKSKHHKRAVCFECVLKEKKSVTRRPYAAMCAALATLLVLLAGCQSAPSKASVEIRIAGQEVVMNFRK